MVSISPAAPLDRERIAAMLAHAFRDDPAFCYILPDERDRALRLARLFRLLFDSDGRAGGLRLTADRGVAASLWRRPGHARIGWAEMLTRALPILSALGGATGRALRVAGATEERMPPTSSFWYLHYAGCEPSRQGSGLGSAVIRAGLAQVGAAPVYLETAQPANLGFYERLGFAVTAEWQAFRGGPRFWSMLRPSP